MMSPALEILPPLADEPVPPFALPVLLDDDGRAWLPHGFRADMFTLTQVCEGIAIGWAPVPELGKVLLHFIGGNPFAPTDEALAAALSKRGLRRMIADLQSIERQWEGD
ncbi:hypothetical protein M527_07170 [Sphingobium indicum IP26]|uniref:Uncharacterized protein n=1 Tax=Sphingobium indicum F2 TaxID=1450518 RepID=A0A8E0WSW3_9SPHN|nr:MULTISPECIES: hypothetical protein [Sphingobium]EPR09897.1 hypothetical protein M527_07170 [Sphingobium indicum IP26]EQB05025.1 hypothetical protein L286_09685 [Sphingobium sp. HDIP04]KER36691.1 hypothetical protein AL00_09465 [Sphingobium indicum F2]